MILSQTVTYTHHRLIGFDIHGLALYEETTNSYTIYACNEKELALRVKQFKNYALGLSQYNYRRHPKSYLEAIIT